MRKENDKSSSFSILFPYSFSFFLTDHLTWTHKLNVAIVSTFHRATGSCSSRVTPQNFHIHHSSFFFFFLATSIKYLKDWPKITQLQKKLIKLQACLFKSLKSMENLIKCLKDSDSHNAKTMFSLLDGVADYWTGKNCKGIMVLNTPQLYHYVWYFLRVRST